MSIKINGIRILQPKQDLYCFKTKSSEGLCHCVNNSVATCFIAQDKQNQPRKTQLTLKNMKRCLSICSDKTIHKYVNTSSIPIFLNLHQQNTTSHRSMDFCNTLLIQLHRKKGVPQKTNLPKTPHTLEKAGGLYQFSSSTIKIKFELNT